MPITSFTLSRRALAVAGVGVATSGGSRNAAAQDPATPQTAATPPLIPVPVDPQMQDVLDALLAFEAPPLPTVDPFNARSLPSAQDAAAAVLAGRGEPALEPVGKISHVLIPGLDDNEILVRLYYPKDAATELLPVLVYFHGGGFVIANLKTYDSSCRALANAAGCIVASVNYRLAPENPFPAAVNDAFAATQYFLSSAGAIGGDTARVAVAGESAGGNLATVTCLRARDEGALMPIHQLLVYPYVSLAPEGEAAESVETFASAIPLGAPALDWFRSYYLADQADVTNPYASPLVAADLSGIPSVTMVQAEIDPLLSQGTVYGDALEAAGVTVDRQLYVGVTHEFFGLGAVVDQAKYAVGFAASGLMTAFESEM